MNYLGDFALGATFDLKFTTRAFASGAPSTLGGTPVVSAYVDNSTTELTAGITLTPDFDSRTGLNHLRIVASSGNGYASGSNYQLVLTAGTVGGVSVVGEVIAHFSLDNSIIPAAEKTAFADVLLKRDLSAVSGEASRSPLNALRRLRNLWIISGSTLTIMKEDDATEAFHTDLTVSPGAAPITGEDPT